jgi:hypothetical protein
MELPDPLAHVDVAPTLAVGAAVVLVAGAVAVARRVDPTVSVVVAATAVALVAVLVARRSR